MTDWAEKVFATYKLAFIQRFTSDLGPMCSRCTTRAVGTWMDWEYAAHDLCAKCSDSPEIEPMIPDVIYRPTQYPKAQPVGKTVDRAENPGASL